MIQNTENFPEGTWDARSVAELLELGEIIQQGNCRRVSDVEPRRCFSTRWPGYVPPDDFNASYDLWTTSTLDTMRGVLRSSRASGRRIPERGHAARSTAGAERQLRRQDAGDPGREYDRRRGGPAAPEAPPARDGRRSNAQTVYMANQTNKDAQDRHRSRSWVMEGASAQIGNGLTGTAPVRSPSGFEGGEV